jgi:hypothetical protein
MSDELTEYLTIDKAAKVVGCTRRTLYRIIARVGPEAVVTQAFGLRLVHKSKLPILKAAYIPLGSKKHSLHARVWGAAGGTQKAINAAKKTYRESR